MNTPVEQSLEKIENREWQLLSLTLGLLLVFGGVTVFTFYFIQGPEQSTENPFGSLAQRLLIGLFVLICLFCAYVFHSRVTFGKMRSLLEMQAMRDPLTGLFNRRYFEDRIKEQKARADRYRSVVALLLCDLDHFKALNDNQGHHVGDDVLRDVAVCIQDATRGSDLVFRWGGDEMLVVLSDTTRDGVLFAADRIREGVQKLSEKIQHPLDISIGVALYPEHCSSIDKLVLLADRALWIAKKGGGKVHIGEDIHPVNEQSIKVVFQPVIDTRSDQILGYEALSRDPSGKIGILELFKRYQAVGQLNELKCLCFRMQLERARALGIQRVFINVDFNMLNQLQAVQKPGGMDVILEISEAEALYEIDRFLETAKRWRALGFKFAIDDFGAGFISLPFVARLIPDYIKLDRSTIVQAVSSEQFGNFLKDLVLALRNYSKEGIIAEGIENEKELKVAERIGGFLVQGYFMGKEKYLS